MLENGLSSKVVGMKCKVQLIKTFTAVGCDMFSSGANIVPWPFHMDGEFLWGSWLAPSCHAQTLILLHGC